jgi:hypothetical protein
MRADVSVRHHVGRLVEIHLRAREIEAFEVQEFMQMLKNATNTAAKNGGSIVVIGDLRSLTVVGPRLAETIVNVMRADNDRLLRSGQLVTAGATFGMQLERVIRDAKHPNRRRFEAADGVVAWLGEVLTPPERTRLEMFLREGP